jgi:predicted Zn-dependent protease
MRYDLNILSEIGNHLKNNFVHDTDLITSYCAINQNNVIMKKLILMIIFILACIGQNIFAQDTPASELEKARQLGMQGKKQEANEILGKLMASEPDNRTAVQYWLIANMKRSPTGEMDAIVQLDSLQKLYPKNTGIKFFRIFILAEYGKTEEALAGFEELTRLQPDSAFNWIGKGQMLSELKRHEEAAAAFETALKLDPKRFDVWAMYASNLAHMKKYDAALVAINKGIELNPGYAGNIYNRACIYCLKGDKTHALEDLGTAIKSKPQLKQHARTDEDMKSLWEDADFKMITE